MLFEKIAGVLIVPVAGAVATRLVSKKDETVETQAYKGAAVHAVVALAAYYASKQPLPADIAHFARGGMWGSAAAATFLAAAPTLSPGAAKAFVNPPALAPKVSGDSDTLRSAVKVLTAS